MSAPGSAMCDLCRWARPMNDDPSTRDFAESAVAFAVHFMLKHPEVPSRSILEHVIVVEVKL